MDAVILAGGKNTRLYEIVPPYHKVFIPINGVPMIVRVLEAVKPFVDRSIIVAAPENAQAMAQLLAHTKMLDDVDILVHHTPIGPGDALRRGLAVSEADDVVVVCADNMMTEDDVRVCVESGSFTIGIREVREADEAARLTRITEDFQFIEGAPGGAWSDGLYRCWLGPLVVPRRETLEILPSLRGWTGGEIKIAPYLDKLPTPKLQRVNVSDIGVPQELTREHLHVQADQLPCARWEQIALLHAMIDLDIITELECQHPTCLYDTRKFDLSDTAQRMRDKYALTFDHVFPQRFGENHRIPNLRIVHRGCNSSYKDRSENQRGQHVRPEHMPRGDDHWMRREPIVKQCPHCEYSGNPGNVGKHVKNTHKEN